MMGQRDDSKAAEFKNSTFRRNRRPDFGQYTSEQAKPRRNNQHNCRMNQQPKTEKKPKNKSKVQIRDLKPNTDAKGGDGPSETITFNYSKPHVQY
jgi:hypothetical protein